MQQPPFLTCAACHNPGLPPLTAAGTWADDGLCAQCVARKQDDLRAYIRRCGELVADGFREGRPFRPWQHDANAVDRHICADATCERCGHHGLDYRSWSRSRIEDGRLVDRYVAFALCPVCGIWEEF